MGFQNKDSQIQGDKNSVALISQLTFPSVTSGFTITETGAGSCETFTSDLTVPPGLTFSFEFSALGDGTASGNCNLLSSDGTSNKVYLQTDLRMETHLHLTRRQSVECNYSLNPEI
jgi:hypothetical protein